MHERRSAYRDPLIATSGITISIGYDLQFVSEQQFRTDWGDRLWKKTSWNSGLLRSLVRRYHAIMPTARTTRGIGDLAS
jgi:hypothetical protein